MTECDFCMEKATHIVRGIIEHYDDFVGTMVTDRSYSFVCQAHHKEFDEWISSDRDSPDLLYGFGEVFEIVPIPENMTEEELGNYAGDF